MTPNDKLGEARRLIEEIRAKYWRLPGATLPHCQDIFVLCDALERALEERDEARYRHKLHRVITGELNDCALKLKAAEAEVETLTLKRREQFNRWGVEIRYDDQEQLALKLERAEAEVVQMRAGAQAELNDMKAKLAMVREKRESAEAEVERLKADLDRAQVLTAIEYGQKEVLRAKFASLGEAFYKIQDLAVPSCGCGCADIAVADLLKKTRAK